MIRIPSLRHAVLPALAPLAPSRAQQPTKFDRERLLIMLSVVRQDIEKNYFDSTYGGVSLPLAFDSAAARIRNAGSNGEMLAALAQATLELDDSHTSFVPPRLAVTVDYGWDMAMIGDTCRVVLVRPGSDAEAQGIHRGDAVLALEGHELNRENLWRLKYAIAQIAPRNALHVAVQSPTGGVRQLVLAAKVTEGREYQDFTTGDDFWRMIRLSQNAADSLGSAYVEFGEGVLYWKLREFDGDSRQVNELLKRVQGRKALVLDLRDNPGGSVTTLTRLIGGLYADNVAVAEAHERGRTVPMTAKGTGQRHFGGTLVVLVNSGSASASELLARTAQITRRGAVLGDRTAGAVRESRMFAHRVGMEVIVPYGASVTVADLVMPDGGTLEKVGVRPDEVVLPSAEDMAAGRDPALARAMALIGLSMSPADAGTILGPR
jgi:C-terminal processing protease CtpA/Prc